MAKKISKLEMDVTRISKAMMETVEQNNNLTKAINEIIIGIRKMTEVVNNLEERITALEPEDSNLILPPDMEV